MARKPSDEPLSKHTLNLYAGDYQKIKDLFPDGDAASIIRNVLRQYIIAVESAGQTPRIDVGVEL